MRLFVVIFVFVFAPACLRAEIPRVPSKIEFAGIQLNLTEGARKDIQQDVDAIHRNQQYFERRLEKVDLYFPVIEKVLREAGVPDDFKYLVIQESALIPDAVSSSNAVGYWQFKSSTAIEMGMRVDRNIDERMNIVSSTMAAAKYLKQHNFYFENWLYSLLAYQAGRGGAEKHVDIKNRGAKKMDVNKHTYWYVKKFLAHKIAYENEVGKNEHPDYVFLEYNRGNNQSLEEIALQHRAEIDLVLAHNKWLRRGRIPDDKEYTVVIPLPPDQIRQMLAMKDNQTKPVPQVRKTGIGILTAKNDIPADKYNFSENDLYPIVKELKEDNMYKINGIQGYVAKHGDTPLSVASLMDMPLYKFLKYNDMTINDGITSGQVYYFKHKHGKARIHYHITMPGETLWDISQKYGIKLKKLMMKNRMKSEVESEAGRVLWLRFIRPANVEIDYRPIPKPQIEEEESIMISENQRAGGFLFEETANQVPVKMKESPDSGEELRKKEIASSNFIGKKNYTDIEEEAAIAPMEDLPEKSKSLSEDSNANLHTVRAGETFYSISKKYDIPISEILVLNKIQQTDTLKIGQTLILANGNEKETNLENHPIEAQIIIHKVKTSETLYGIARQYNVTIKEIMEWNNKVDFDLKIGEELKVHKTE